MIVMQRQWKRLLQKRLHHQFKISLKMMEMMKSTRMMETLKIMQMTQTMKSIRMMKTMQMMKTLRTMQIAAVKKAMRTLLKKKRLRNFPHLHKAEKAEDKVVKDEAERVAAVFRLFKTGFRSCNKRKTEWSGFLALEVKCRSDCFFHFKKLKLY